MLNFDGIESNSFNFPSTEHSQISFLNKKLPMLKTVQKNQQLVDEISAIINLFSTLKSKPIKKENLRVSVIRNHKKLLRMIFYPKKNHRPYQKSILKSQNKITCFQKFRDHSILNKDILETICKPLSGPKSERKVLKVSEPNNCSKSFNDFYLYNYFKVDAIKHSFLEYVKFLFADFNISELRKDLKVKCCDSLGHSDECREKWERLENFFSTVMFEDLEERFMPFAKIIQDNYDPADAFLF